MKKVVITQSDRYNTDYFQRIRQANDEIREQIAETLRAIDDPEQKIEKLIEIFLGYDYDYGRVFLKIPEIRKFKLDGVLYESPGFTNTAFEDSPTVHLAKLAQCTTFAHETAIALCSNSISCKVVRTEFAPCFNIYTKSICNIGHQYNLITLPNGKLRKLDITARIMLRDARKVGANIDENTLLSEK